MDPRAFDALARLFSRRIDRRYAVAVALGLATSSAVADVAAADSRRGSCRILRSACTRDSQCCSGLCDTRTTQHRTRRNRCACPEGLATCGSACIDLQFDARHCGACGNACPDGPCVDGVCLSIGPCATNPADPYDFCLHTVEGEDIDIACGHSDMLLAYADPEAYACTSSSQCDDIFPSCAGADVACACTTGGWDLLITGGGFVWEDAGFPTLGLCVPYTRNPDRCPR